MEGWMECGGGGCREVGAWGSLGGLEGRCGGAVEGVEAGREAGLNDQVAEGESRVVRRGLLDQLLVDRCGLDRWFARYPLIASKHRWHGWSGCMLLLGERFFPSRGRNGSYLLRMACMNKSMEFVMFKCNSRYH